VNVKAALYAPDITWYKSLGSIFVRLQIGLDDNFQQDAGFESIQKVLPQVIEHTNRVLVANGDIDLSSSRTVRCGRFRI
jgi:carboxypeptidase D